MKPYFAKYLPVPGDVEIGDLFRDTAGNVRPADELDIRLDAYISQRLPANQKVALHLCSRDIQKGDVFKIDIPSIPQHLEERTCIEIVEPSEYDTSLALMYMINKTGAHCKQGECFKVIGLISPEVTWVKEGDEFDEDELAFKANLTSKPYTPFWGVLRQHPKSLEQEMDFYIALKGPCGHYH